MNSDIQKTISKNESEYYKKIRSILSKQDKVAVSKFINLLKSNPYFWVVFVGKSKPEKTDHLAQMRKALSSLEKVMDHVDSGIIDSPIEGLSEAKEYLAYCLVTNQPLKTGGRRSQLSSNDLLHLYILRQVFRKCFPRLSGNFVRNNILSSLGEDLLDKPLPKSINEMIKELEEFNEADKKANPKLVIPRTK
mgnify:CR=1 FL=1